MGRLIRGEPARSNLPKLVEPLAQHRMIGDRHRDLYRSVRVRALSAGFPDFRLAGGVSLGGRQST